MLLDGAGWHKSQTVTLPANIGLLYLPPYSPQINPVEHLWEELREKHFHNHAFDSLARIFRRGIFSVHAGLDVRMDLLF